MKKIDMPVLLKKIDDEYSFLYDHDDNVAGYREAVAYGDDYIGKHPDVIGAIIKARGDIFSSDREVGALMFAMDSLGYLDD